MSSFARVHQSDRSARRSGRNRKSKRSGGMEMLEARQLLSAVTSYPTDAFLLTSIAPDVNNSIWSADGSSLYHFTSSGMQIGDPLTFTDPNTGTACAPFDVVFSHYNDHLYFSDTNHAAICEVSLGGDLINVFQVPNTATEQPIQLAVTSDGAVWFATQGGDNGSGVYSAEIGRMDHFGNMTFATITDGSQPNEIAAASDDTVWFDTLGAGAVNGSGQQVQQGNAGVGHVALGANGAISVDQFYAFSTPGSLGSGLAIAGDGSLWYAVDNRAGAFEVQPATGPDRIVHGVLSGGTLLQTEYVLPGATADSPATIGGVDVENAAGRVWFSEESPAHISYLDIATGNFVELGVPSTAGMPVNLGIAGDHVWATGVGGPDNLMRVVIDGFQSPVGVEPANITATTGVQYSGPLTTFHTADTGPYTYNIDFGDGQTASGSINSDGSGNYTINATVTYAAAGNYAIHVSIMTADGDVATTSGVATVSDPSSQNVVAQGVNLTGQQDIPLASNMTIGSDHVIVVATFTGPVASYSATINWGDTTSSAGTIYNLGGGTYAVAVASKTYHSNAAFNGSVTITGGPNVATANFVATISDTPMVVSTGMQLQLTQGRHFTGTVALFSDDIESTKAWFTATINWGNGSVTNGVIVADTAAGPGHYIVTGSNLYSGKKQTYQVQITITNVVEGTTSVATAFITI